MLIVGLTGGIGSGKTAVSNLFAQRGVPIIDTDILARELVSPGQPALEEIAEQFGPDCLDDYGELDRAYLRSTVFANPRLRKRLEVILHPRIRCAVLDHLKVLDTPYCIVVIPLLVETAMTDLTHRILVVDVPENVQIRRVMARDQVNEAQVQHILAAQANRKQRLAVADDTINNDGSLSDLKIKVSAMHAKYLKLAVDIPVDEPSLQCGG